MMQVHAPRNDRSWIKLQGDLDGACFLYALVNAVSCLNGRVITDKAWQRLVGEVFDPRAFLDGTRGTVSLDAFAPVLKALVNDYAAILDPRSKYRVSTFDPSAKADGSILLTKHSVLVVATQAHWSCLVDADAEWLYFACSAAWQANRHEYKEARSTRLDRWFNETQPLRSSKRWLSGLAFSLTRVPQ